MRQLLVVRPGLKWAVFVVSCLGLVQSACAPDPEPADLTSLRRSGEASFFCIGPEGTGVPVRDCALGDFASDGDLTVGPPGYTLHALVTQTVSAEVAVIRVAADGEADGKVLDVDPTNPGVTPLRVGAQPVGITTTPGGLASFVAIAETGKEGIFALPTNCVFAPDPTETRRDLTTWPACRLTSKPGTIEVLVDGGATSGGQDYCGSGPSGDAEYGEDDDECRVDLSKESYEPGRRKLVVSLPLEGKLVVLDAQELLNRRQGTYDACHIEAELELDATFPEGLVQPLPADLIEDGKVSFEYPAIVGEYKSHPAGMDTYGDLLAIADRGAPLIHLLDARDPCGLVELEPLYATSYNSPNRLVTTTRVAISPVTKKGEQFVYAIDEVGDELSDIIPFDVSFGAISRLPMLRPGSPLLPFEAPDRISFGAAVKDVAFAELDRPLSEPVLGQSFSDISCDPSPNLSESAVGAQYRPSSDDVGAAPGVLRGTFAYALLSSGRLSIIDIEDYDAPCRRPRTINPSSTPDFRGCFDDDDRFDYYTNDQTADGLPTVSDEVSCRTVVPHRARSALFFETTEGSTIQAPSLQGHVTLSRHGRTLSLSRLTSEGKKSPLMLGVDFESPDGTRVPAQLYLGSTLLTAGDANAPLVIDPNLAERANLVLPFYEPRAYPTSETISVVYEGDIDRLRTAGKVNAPNNGFVSFTDQAGNFCARGVQGQELTKSMGTKKFGLDEGALDRFVERHTDYVQITNLLLDGSDTYWQNAGATCGDGLSSSVGRGYALCDSVFRVGDADDLAPRRDFTVISAHDESLVLAPRGESDRAVAQAQLELMRCCFPTAFEYRIRAGNQWVVRGSGTGFQHPIIADESSEDLPCIFDPSPRAKYLTGRAFEISNNNCEVTSPTDPEACAVGPRTDADVVCTYDADSGPVQVGSQTSACISSSLTRRLAVYRGLTPSLRDMAFSAEIIGGFDGFSISLNSNSPNVLPVSLNGSPGVPILGVVDSQNNGLSVVDLVNSQVAQNFY